jgi:hypothetical protein
MKQKGLLTEVIQNRRAFLIPEDPNTLVKRAEDEAREAQQAIVHMQELVPELMTIFNAPGSKAKIKYYQGIDGLKKLYNDTLIPNSTLRGFLDADKVIAVMGDWIWGYLERRVEMKMKYQVIAKRGAWEKDLHINHREQGRSVKFVGDVKFDTEIDIYANKVSIYSFRPPYAGIIIEDYAIHNTVKSIWQLLWDSLK